MAAINDALHVSLTALRYTAPTTITIVGYVLGLLGIAHGVAHGYPLLIASVLCDLADGAVARRLGAVTVLGGEIDLSVDTLLAHGLLWVTLPGEMAPCISVLLLGWQAFARTSLQVRVSGRAMAWGLCFVWVFAAGNLGTPLLEGL